MPHGDVPEGIVQRQQLKWYQATNEHTCLTISFANLLYACNSQEHANRVFTIRKKFEHEPRVLGLFNEFINKLSPNLHTKKIELSYCNLEDNYYNLAVLTCLIDNQGKEDHTVAIYKGWIYDGNLLKA